MQLSTTLAQMFGIAYLAVGLGMIMDSKYYHKLYSDFYKTPGLTFVTALLVTVIGFFIVRHHNLWVKSWEVIITILGWGALIKGLLLLIVPNGFMGMFEGMFKKQESFTYYGFVVLVLGAVLAYFGFVA